MEFDLVIFDEASQITVPEAIGAIARARAVVVVGDSKQMPPSRRVGTQTAAEEEFDDSGDEEIVEDQESILSECELARVPTLSLSWHYRSQDEALIAFSNRAYYDGGLSSFPTPSLLSSTTGVQFVPVDGQFIRTSSRDTVDMGRGVVAGKGTNPVEARAVVDTVASLLAAENAPTIGIVTFNEQQRLLIEDLLRAYDDPNINAAMDENAMGPSDVLFIKALEQVQGDERDVVLFSVAFSKPRCTDPLERGGPA
ncbi:DEAD/DEAH box helicase [Microbacterium aurantiacum]|uniref:DEAD/DEAH box helicase n=1 Tax=Microbacterium aurantiacum TaxID=162393 RepID=UPI0012E90BFF|nr:DEAD/DEAH box helicase [Microbacterium chocolatum]